MVKRGIHSGQLYDFIFGDGKCFYEYGARGNVIPNVYVDKFEILAIP